MVNFPLGQQSGYTKYPCFICLWDSRAYHEHWIRKEWPLRKDMVVGQHNIVNECLVDRDKIILPPLHIKLGLMKQFVKALNKEGPCFGYISSNSQTKYRKTESRHIWWSPDKTTYEWFKLPGFNGRDRVCYLVVVCCSCQKLSWQA